MTDAAATKRRDAKKGDSRPGASGRKTKRKAAPPSPGNAPRQLKAFAYREVDIAAQPVGSVPCGLRPGELIADNFCGLGGASTGIANALGRDPDFGINHSPEAIAVHAANHAGTSHRVQDVWSFDFEDLKNRPVGLGWFSPDCFLAGTLVLTPEGQTPIEAIEEGQLVLTHMNRWRKVASVDRHHAAETVSVAGPGHPGLVTTPGHRFYSKRVETRVPGAGDAGGGRDATEGVTGAAYWPEARSMEGRLWAMPRAVPELPIPVCDGVEFSEGFFRFVGRWLVDGPCAKGGPDVPVPSREPPVDDDGGTLGWLPRSANAAERLARGGRPLRDWLGGQFGEPGRGRRLPTWCLSMRRDWRRALLEGCADGHGRGTQVAAIAATSTTSKALACGIKLLATSLDCTTGTVEEGPGADIMRSPAGEDGRRYEVSWREDALTTPSHGDGFHRFLAVAEVTRLGGNLVHSIEVEEDASFVADGIVVHNCRSFSRAKGGKPRSEKVRDLAWIVIKWAKKTRPRVITLENVPEWETWGSLLTNGRVNPTNAGYIFALWVSQLERMGYRIEYKFLVAADYGAPTIRRRLFLVARCDDLPIVWPKRTHAPAGSADVVEGRALAWRTAAETIDWRIPAHSIFLGKVEGRKVGVKRPLADNTLTRVARGVKRFVIDQENPFLVSLTHRGGERVEGLDRPMATVTGANRGEKALCEAATDRAAQAGFLAKFRYDSEGATLDAPMPTVTANSFEKRPGGAAPLALVGSTSVDAATGMHPVAASHVGAGDAGNGTVRRPASEDRTALIAPLVTSVAHGDSGGKRSYAIDEPLGTQTRTNTHAVVAPVVSWAQQGGGSRRADAPLHTITASRKDQNALIGVEAPFPGVDPTAGRGTPSEGATSDVAGSVIRHFGGSVGSTLDEPIGTATAGGGGKTGLLATRLSGEFAAYVAQQNGGMIGTEADRPLSTIVGKGCTQTPVTVRLDGSEGDRDGVVASHVINMKGTDRRASDMRDPVPAVTSGGNHVGAVDASVGRDLSPAELAGARRVAAFLRERGCWSGGDVVVLRSGRILTDISMRMLKPRELATAQGFSKSYVIDPFVKGKPMTATKQVHLIGNSVVPQVSAAIVHANVNLAPLLGRIRERYQPWGEALRRSIEDAKAESERLEERDAAKGAEGKPAAKAAPRKRRVASARLAA